MGASGHAALHFLPFEWALMNLKAPEGAGFTFVAVFLETI